MELLALGKPIKKPPRSDERDGELFCGTPTEGISCSRVNYANGYYDYAFGISGWSTSTSLIFNCGNMNLGGGQWFLFSGVSSASCDGTPITPSSGLYYFPMSTQDGNDHTITFTVQSGNLPTLSSNYYDAGKYITKAIFNK